MTDKTSEYYNVQGTQFAKVGKFKEAKIEYEKALENDPYNLKALSNMAGVCCIFGDFDEAISLLNIIINKESSDADALNNLLRIHIKKQDISAAAVIAKKLLKLLPDHVGAVRVLGNHYIKTNQPKNALKYLSKAAEQTPDDVDVLKWLVQAKLCCCDWDNIVELMDKVARSAEDEKNPAVYPLHYTCVSYSAEQHKHNADKWWRQELKSKVDFIHNANDGRFTFENRNLNKDKIRIGYFSADFRKHPVASLVAEHLELHDKNKFELYAYSFCKDDGSYLRQRTKQFFDVFRDMQDMGAADAAKIIYDDDIDVLIDMAGHTLIAPTEVVASRPAPVIINWLGYPGTMGGDFADYIIADGTIIPAGAEKNYSEHVIRMPNCYQANDSKRKISTRKIERSDYGLPEDGLVFCCFNGLQKITPDVFDVWLRLLDKVPDSVLWLLYDDNAKENIIKYARNKGCDVNRIVFARHVPMDEHVARYQLVSIFLDTIPYNAHTTGSEALFMGCPMVAIMGDSFPSRVGASLLNAVGLPELITKNLADYEALITELSCDSLKLEALRARLRLNVEGKALLFDTPSFTKSFESAISSVWGMYKKG
ncbi:MAG: tetratricopeptide repeat protein [Alphaproteobacteria bacterium]|nr:tetratricopeptide repeat protein [Alphaproteobacteria bacterium]